MALNIQNSRQIQFLKPSASLTEIAIESAPPATIGAYDQFR